MPWPPTVPPTNRTNATAQLDAHVSDHNAGAQALNDLVTKIGALPLGRIATSYLTASPPTITSAGVDILTVPFTIVQGRRYRLSAVVTAASTVAGQTFYAILTDGANQQVQAAASYVSASGQPMSCTPWAEILGTAGNAGARVYKVRGSVTGSNVTLNVSPTQPIQLMVEDIGT